MLQNDGYRMNIWLIGPLARWYSSPLPAVLSIDILLMWEP